jgi:transcriptional regulator of heat shock response
MSPSIQNLRLPDLAEFLSERTSGRKLGDVTESEIEALVKHLAEWGRGYDTLVHPLHDLIMDARLGESPRTIMYGAAGLLKASGDNADSLARAVELLDNRTSFEKTLGQVPGDEKVRVYIGGREFIPENRGDALLESILEGFALVVGTYHLHSRSAGQLGIVGPLRTPYEHHLGLVRSVADTISRTLIARELGFHSN